MASRFLASADIKQAYPARREAMTGAELMTELPILGLAQINPTVGDLKGNAEKIEKTFVEARDSGARIIVYPELCLPGYPAEDLYLREDFILANRQALEKLAPALRGATAVVGFADPTSDRPGRAIAANAAAVIVDGAIAGIYHKRALPNYGVFDEFRTFASGEDPLVLEVEGLSVGITICEDCWETSGPVFDRLAPDADLIVNLSASPFHEGKIAERERIFASVAKERSVPVAMTNLVGGQDELIFDGGSVLYGPDGNLLARSERFRETVLVAGSRAPTAIAPLEAGPKEVYEALLLGLRDYVDKNGFERVGIGLSGGIDSALVAVLAVDALGGERVSCVVMPSPYSSKETQADARELAVNLGCELIEIPIDSAMEVYSELLPADSSGVAAENLQARIRGNLMMAFSNSRGWLVLTTANKSEASVGYSTLYGDMAGGLAPIRDVPKTLAYELCRARNELSPDIPEGILDRPPTAELRPGQLDADSLPPYPELDLILRLYIEEDLGPDEIVSRGEDRSTVERVIQMVDRAEFKRRQSPPGLKVTPKGLGRDRRMPITNRFDAGR